MVFIGHRLQFILPSWDYFPCRIVGKLPIITPAFFGFVIIIWSAGFQETWKRRQALIAFGWGEMGQGKPPPSVNPFFKPKCIKSGFYTEDGLWVELSQQPTDAPASPKSKGSTTAQGSEKQPLVGASGSAPPVDVWFPLMERLKRQWASGVVLLAMRRGTPAEGSGAGHRP